MKTKISKYLVALFLCLTFVFALIPVMAIPAAAEEGSGTLEISVTEQKPGKGMKQFLMPRSFSMNEKSYVSLSSNATGSHKQPVITPGEPSASKIGYAYFDGDHTLTLNAFTLSGAAYMNDEGTYKYYTDGIM